MRLVDLDPRWLIHEGNRVGFVFKCPVPNKPRANGLPDPTVWYQSCFVQKLPSKVQWDLFDSIFGEESYCTQACNPECAWTVIGGIANATFETMTVTPSLDGSAGGLWHGYIRNGEIC